MRQSGFLAGVAAFGLTLFAAGCSTTRVGTIPLVPENPTGEQRLLNPNNGSGP